MNPILTTVLLFLPPPSLEAHCEARYNAAVLHLARVESAYEMSSSWAILQAKRAAKTRRDFWWAMWWANYNKASPELRAEWRQTAERLYGREAVENPWLVP